uniref:Small ribosomal subunit protein uS10 domain-containing protein n=1 Tax=Kalanchoe fedtschenkoi TaxID=63787 RepID=A0A7N0UI92_KALFE
MALRQKIAVAAASSLVSRRVPLAAPSARCFSNASGEMEYDRGQVSGQIGMPVRRSLFTVLRSPHVDKKSREQFKTEVKQEFVVMKLESHQLDKKLFWLKRRKDFGTMEVKINVKTRFPQDRKDLFQTASKCK